MPQKVITSDDSAYTWRFDYDVNGNLIYEGRAAAGTAATAAGWKITRHTYTGVNRTLSELAGSTVEAKWIWNNRAGLTYA